MAQNPPINPTYTTVDPSTDASGNANVTNATLISGENQTLNRLFGGNMASYAEVTADTLVKTGAGVLYGVFCVANGTMANIYDNTSAAGTKVMIPGAMTAGQSITYGGVGVYCPTGIYADWTSGTFLVLYI